MGYNDASKKSTMKYIKEKQQEIKVRYKKDEYENDILPVIEQTGLPVATFIKQAVSEKIIVETNKGYDLEITLESIKNSALKKLPEIMKEDCRQIILYGSCARGDIPKNQMWILLSSQTATENRSKNTVLSWTSLPLR